MSAIRQILVSVKEFNGRPVAAVLKAAQLARAYGARVELFHALTAPLSTDRFAQGSRSVATLAEESRLRALRRLEAIADRLRLHGIKVTVCVQWDFPAYEAIIRRARAIKADLIVASQHGGSHRWPWLLRLTDWELIRMSPMPVLLVKNPHAYRRPAVLAAVDPSCANSKPETLDREILRTADKLSAALNGHLHAVHAYARFPLNVPPEALTPGMIESMQAQADRTAQKQLTRALKSLRVARKRQHLIARPPVEAISEVAAATRSAIVVMGAISRSGFKRVLIGNTAEQILDALTCDILIIKPATFRNRVPATSRGVRVQNVAAGPGVFF